MIHNDDCLSFLSHSVLSQSIDMVIADLPYNVTRAKFDKEEIDLTKLWEHLKRVTKPNAAIIFTATMSFAIKLINSNPKWFRYDLIWEKPNPSGHLNANRQPMRSHELILIFYNKLPTYTPQKTSGHVRKISERKRGMSEIYNPQTQNTSYDSMERYPRSVLKFPADTQKCALHPTQKPIALIEYLIKTYTKENDVILDPTAGSGTTAIAAINTNRKYIAIEKDKKYFDIARKRINEANQANRLFTL